QGRTRSAPPRSGAGAAGVRVLVVSADPEVRALMGLAVQGVRRKTGHDEPFELLHASDGLAAMAIAWRADLLPSHPAIKPTRRRAIRMASWVSRPGRVTGSWRIHCTGAVSTQ